MSTAPARAHTSTWTPARRKLAADRIRARKPWLESTGPRTLTGKSVSKMNAYKNGMRSAEVLARRRALVHFLREQKEFLRAVKAIIKLRKAIKKANAANEVMTPAFVIPSEPLWATSDLPCAQNENHREASGDPNKIFEKSANEVIKPPAPVAEFLPVPSQPRQYWPYHQWIAASCDPDSTE